MTQQSIHDRVMSRQKTMESGEETLTHQGPKSGSRLMQRVALFGALGLSIVVGSAIAFLFHPIGGSLLGDQASAQVQPSSEKVSAQGDTPFDKHISQAGIHGCAKVFSALGQALTLGSSYAVKTQWNDTSADTHTLQAVAGMSYDTSDYKGQAAGIVFASPIDQGCEGNLVRVVPFPKTCQEVVATLPQGSKLSETLSGTPLYDIGNNANQVLLVPAGNSCVVVTVARGAG